MSKGFASLTGDFKALDVIGKRVGKLASPASMRGLARAIGGTVLFEVQLGFSEQRDPYGTPWDKKVIPDGNRILVGKTGKLRLGWYLKYVGPDAVIVGNRQPYAAFQSGTGVYGPTGQPIKPKSKRALSWKGAGGRFTFKSVRGAPPRLMVPRTNDMPLTWNRQIAITAREYMRARLAGR